MAWNFCPSCGHRIYQHTVSGCTAIVKSNKVEWIAGQNRRKEEPCDCDMPFEGLTSCV